MTVDGSRNDTYDLAVVGAGAGGMNAARQAVELGLSVVLIDEHDTGGECTWAGCIPSKALIQIADDVAVARRYASVTVDGPAMLQRVRDRIGIVHEAENPATFTAAGVDYVQGRVRFLDPHTIEAAGRTVRFSRAVVCTGSAPVIPPVDGLRDLDVLTNQNVFQLHDLPSSLLVLGGGAIGVELAQAMQRLGVRVTLIEQCDQVLPREEPELAQRLADVLAAEGVTLRLGTTAVEAREQDGQVVLTVRCGEQSMHLSAERILVASGRRPNTKNFGLCAAGVEFTRAGIHVNEYMQTTAPHIYAAGDVVGQYQFSHVGEYEGRLAVRNAFTEHPEPAANNYPWCTFTHPELARTGMTEAEAAEALGHPSTVYVSYFADVDRAKVEDKTAGMAKVMCDAQGRIVGASILGERACELLGELLVLQALEQPLHTLFDVVHPFPGYSDVLLALRKR